MKQLCVKFFVGVFFLSGMCCVDRLQSFACPAPCSSSAAQKPEQWHFFIIYIYIMMVGFKLGESEGSNRWTYQISYFLIVLMTSRNHISQHFPIIWPGMEGDVSRGSPGLTVCVLSGELAIHIVSMCAGSISSCTKRTPGGS